MNTAIRLGSICLLCFLGTLLGHADDRTWYTGSTVQTTYSDWMAWVPDDVPLSEMSIPGTHDSLSRYGGGIAQTQTLPLMEQLMSGIRVFDLRLRHESDRFTVYHGPIYQKATFGDVLLTCNLFLSIHPTETLLLYVGNDGVPDPVNNSREYIDTFKWYRDQSGLGGWISTNIVDKAYATPLGQARGKIVILQQMGCDDCGLRQKGIMGNGYWNLNTTFDIPVKWEKVMTHFQLIDAARLDSMFENAIDANSDNGGVWPIDVANGVPGYDGLTIRTFRYLFGANQHRTGLVYMDFPGAALIGTVIAHNMRFASNLSSALTRDLTSVVNDAGYASIQDGGTDATARASQMKTFLEHILPEKHWSVVVSADEGSENFGYSLQPEGFFRRTEAVSGMSHVIINTSLKNNGIDSASLSTFLTPTKLQTLGGSAMNRADGVRKFLEAEFPWARWNAAVKRIPLGSQDWAVLPAADVAFSSAVPDDGQVYAYTVWAAAGDNLAPVANGGGVYVAFEGETVTFDASGSSDIEGAPLMYRWNLDADGVWDRPFTNSPVATHVYANNNTAPAFVRLEVSDGQLATSVSITLKILNVAPQIQAVSKLALWGDSALSETLHIIDPGADNWSARIDYGDTVVTQTGFQDSKSIPLSHAYAKPGLYTIRVRVSDGDDQTDAQIQVAAGLPALQIEPAGNSVRLSWTNHPALPFPVRASDWAASRWEVVPGTSSVEGDRRVLLVPASERTEYFKLSLP